MIQSKVLIVGNGSETLDDLVKEMETEFAALKHVEPDEAKSGFAREMPAAVLLYDVDKGSALEFIEYVNERKQSLIYFISQMTDYHSVREVLKSGVKDYVVAPAEIRGMLKNLKRDIEIAESGLQQAAAAQPAERSKGKVITFYSGKGGSGRTLMASSFAQTLQLDSNADVLAIDLNLQMGGMETYFGLQSNNSLADLKPVINELNESHIRNLSMTQEDSSLQILLSPRDAEVAETMTEEDITKMIRACRRYFDFIIIDVGSEVTAPAYAALVESNLIYYMLTLDTPSIHTFKHAEQLLSKLDINLQEKLQLIVNMKSKRNELKTKDIKEFIGYPVAAEFNHYQKHVEPYVNQGKPLRKEVNEKRLNPLAGKIKKWASQQLKAE